MSLLLLLKQTAAAATLTCSGGSVSLVGNEATLRVGRKVVAATGAIRLEANIPTAVFSDNFNRADAANLGANWNIIQGGFTITSNKVYGNITDYRSIALPTANYSSNQGAKITVSGDFVDAADHVGVGVRLSSGVAQDYRNWTELDPTSVLSRIPSLVTISGMNAISGTGVHGQWYDGGTNWKTGDFWSSINTVTVTSGGNNSRFIIAAVTTNNTSGADSGNENRPSIQVVWVGTATTPRIELVQYRSTDNLTSTPIAIDSYQGSAVAVNTPFYIEFERVGSVANCRIYSDASHLTLVDTLTITLTEVVSFRYFYVAGKSSTGSSATVSATIGPVNFDTPQTGYIFRGDGFPDNTRTLRRLSYGNLVAIGAPALPIIDGDIVEVTAVDSLISVYINNILKYSVIDTAYTSGKPGITYEWSNTRDVFIDDFYSWNISGSADLKASRTLSCATATYNEDLKPANLLVTRRLVADAQTYNEDLKPANLLIGRKLISDTQTYTLDGKDATLTKTTTARTITADVQSYTLGGGQANLIVGRKLTSDTRTYTFAPQPANLLVGRKLTSDTRIYTFAPQPANLKVARTLSATVQAYTLSLKDASLKAGKKLTSDVGSYTLSLKDAALKVGRKVTADKQTYTFNGNNANLKASRTLLADVQSYTLSLKDATLKSGRKLTSDASTYTFAPQPTNVLFGRKLTSDVRAYTLSLNDANLKAARTLLSDKQTYTLTGIPVGLSKTGALPPLVAITSTLTLNGNPVTLRVTRRLISDTQSYTFNGNPTNLLYGRKVIADKQTYTLSLKDAAVKVGKRLVADKQTYTLSLKDAALSRSRKIVADSSSYSLSLKDANVRIGRKLTGNVQTYTLSLKDAALKSGRKLTGDTRSYSLSIKDVNLKYGRKITGEQASYVFTYNGMLFARGGFVKVWTGSAWVQKPLKVWNGAAWVSKPLKIWDGTTWRTY